MKQSIITITSVIVLCSIATLASAAPRGAKGKRHRKESADKAAERIANKEEAILERKDAHAWQKDPDAKDHRHKNLRIYTNHTYKRIVRLLALGALKVDDGTEFKSRHAAIVKDAKAADENGLDAAEKKAIRAGLNTLNDDINAAIVEPEEGNARTPLVNRAQHRFEQRIAFGVKTGRLSTLEASSLRRKVAKLESYEEKLKAGDDLSSSQRERLMKEVVELRRDLNKALRD